jgi:hypothetical protein
MAVQEDQPAAEAEVRSPRDVVSLRRRGEPVLGPGVSLINVDRPTMVRQIGALSK